MISPFADWFDSTHKMSSMPKGIDYIESLVKEDEDGDIDVLQELLDAGFDTDHEVDFLKYGEG